MEKKILGATLVLVFAAIMIAPVMAVSPKSLRERLSLMAEILMPVAGVIMTTMVISICL